MSVEIDWEEQWALNAPEFRDGFAHVPLLNGNILKLLPGPGFGDFSHPTTQLVMRLMENKVSNQCVLDIGCGSGILSLTAAKMGALKIYACDIDPEAITHMRKNAAYHQVSVETHFPDVFEQKPVVLMNMIHSEQINAWKVHNCPFNVLITSGILASDKENYLAFAKNNHWQLIELQESNGWLGCVFKEKNSL